MFPLTELGIVPVLELFPPPLPWEVAFVVLFNCYCYWFICI